MAFNRLYDYETGADLGPATQQQIAASSAAAAHDTGAGVILIDPQGDVVPVGSWDAQQPGVRTVYTL